jgi:hypothetical protein
MTWDGLDLRAQTSPIQHMRICTYSEPVLEELELELELRKLSIWVLWVVAHTATSTRTYLCNAFCPAQTETGGSFLNLVPSFQFTIHGTRRRLPCSSPLSTCRTVEGERQDGCGTRSWPAIAFLKHWASSLLGELHSVHVRAPFRLRIRAGLMGISQITVT